MSWTLANPIRGTAVEHAEYAGIVNWLCAAFEVRALLVSSLIGQALDLLRLNLPTILITHNLYPFCPALSAAFGTPCECCSDENLARCLRENPHNTFWHLGEVRNWQILRTAFAECLSSDNVRIVAPDEDTHARWVALFPGSGGRPWTYIPYGLGAPFARGSALLESGADAGDKHVRSVSTDTLPRLRVLVPGALLPHAGLHLWRQICNELRAFADVLLLGCGDFGQSFVDYAEIEVVPECETEELPGKVALWRPDCALLLPASSENFGYTLVEMQALAIPVVATREGSRVGCIDNGWNGFLVEPEAGAVLDRLRALNRVRDRLATVADILRFSPVRTAFDMVADYRRLLPELEGVETGNKSETLLAILGKRLRGQDELMRLGDLLQERDEQDRARALNQRRLESIVEKLAAQHAAILCSPTWKISAPLRAFGRFWNALRDRISPPPEKPQVVRPRVERRKTPRPEVPVPILLRSRASARYWLCEAIGMPDAAVVIVGGGPDQSRRALQNFIALADMVTRRSTSACFVWCGHLDNPDADDMLALNLLREVRDLFVLDTKLDAEVFAGADVLLLPAEAVGQVGVKGMVAGTAHVDLPMEPIDADNSGVAATVAQLLQYCGDRKLKAEPEVVSTTDETGDALHESGAGHGIHGGSDETNVYYGGDETGTARGANRTGTPQA
jgi:glycosyltransferase involved in cell wall biosynthesis